MSKGLGSPGFIGCLHLGHKWMAQYRGFQDEWYHDDYLIEQWNSVVGKKDLVYILGDITMNTPEHYYKLDLLNGRKRVVLGNHDNPRDVPELLKYVEDVAGAYQYKGCMLTHIPIHPNEISFNRLNIHAHIHHTNKLDDCYVPERYGDVSDTPHSTIDKYYNVDAKLLDFKPITLDKMLEERVNKHE